MSDDHSAETTGPSLGELADEPLRQHRARRDAAEEPEPTPLARVRVRHDPGELMEEPDLYDYVPLTQPVTTIKPGEML